MKLLNRIFTPVLFCSIICILQVRGSQPVPGTGRHSADTTILGDTLVQSTPPNDPRKTFKDLFVATADKTPAYSVQLNPRAITFVQDYMLKHTKQLEEMKDWGKPYFDMMEKVLTARHLPGELKYLAVIESNLKSYALSWAGAVGPWQFMPATARTMGLKVNHSVDERTDYYKSTRAAAKYLTDLYSLYNDWLLVIAAYNGGSGSVNHAIRKSGSHNFWDLQYFLPEESRNHVKKFIATHYIMEGDGGITTLTKDEAKDLVASSTERLTNEERAYAKTQSISGRYNSVVLAQNILMDISTFERYNPAFDAQIGTTGSFELCLPADRMEIFNAKKYQILDESLKRLLEPMNSGGK